MFAVLPTGCGQSLIFQIVPKVCSYLPDRGFSYPKAAIVVVICPLYALIDSHILELKEHSIPACSLADDDLLEDDVASHSIVYTVSCPITGHFLQNCNILPHSSTNELKFSHNVASTAGK